MKQESVLVQGARVFAQVLSRSTVAVSVIEPPVGLIKFWPSDALRRDYVDVPAERRLKMVERWVARSVRRATVAQQCDALSQALRAKVLDWPEKLAAASEQIGPMDYSQWSGRQAKSWLQWLQSLSEQEKKA